MKVVCIKEPYSSITSTTYKSLTVGKIYNVIHTQENIKENDGSSYKSVYLIKGDSYQTLWYPDICFITLDEYRNMKINEVLK